MLIEHPEDLALLASFGLIFLLFYLGVELSIDDLTGGGTRLLASAGIYLALNVGVGLAFGFALGWGTREAFVVAGITGISSSAIVTKIVVELRRLSNPETPMILGIIVIEDLFLALYLAALAPVLGDASSAGEAALFPARPRFPRRARDRPARYGAPLVQKLLGAHEDELLVVLFFGLALTVAGAAEALGVSEAIGAFMAGLLVSGTLVAARVRNWSSRSATPSPPCSSLPSGWPSTRPRSAGRAGAAIGAAVLSLVLAVIAGTVTARLNHLDRTSAANIAFTVLARGEFALVLVTLAAAAGLDERLAPFAAVYVLILAVASPILAGKSGGAGAVVPRPQGTLRALRDRCGCRPRRRCRPRPGCLDPCGRDAGCGGVW